MSWLTDPRFVSILATLESEGAFKGIKLGSTAFVERLQLAGRAFEARVGSESKPEAAAAAASAAASTAAAPTASSAAPTDGDAAFLDETASGMSWEAMDEFKALGNEKFRAKQWFAAAMAYGRALAVCPVKGPRSILLANRAAALTEASVLDEAEHDARLAVRIQPTYAKAYYRLGMALTARDRRAEAISCLEKALELDPDLSGARAAIRSIQASQRQR